MTTLLLTLAIVGGALICPALMWLGRRGVGPGCAACPPRREESLDDLRARQRALAAQIDDFEAGSAEPRGRARA